MFRKIIQKIKKYGYSSCNLVEKKKYTKVTFFNILLILIFSYPICYPLQL